MLRSAPETPVATSPNKTAKPKDAKKRPRQAEVSAKGDERLNKLAEKKARKGEASGRRAAADKAKRTGKGANKGRGNKKKDEDEEQQDAELEQEDAFWQDIVSASYRSRKVRGDWSE